MSVRSIAVAALMMVATCLPSLAQEKAQAPDIVTVVGKVAETNRGALDPFMDSLFHFHEKEFEKAYGFSYAALAALPQVTVAVGAEGWPAPVTARGPKLSDVLDAAGVSPNSRLAFLSLDGYALELEPQERASKEWVLAIAANGRPLGIGGRGPAWLLYDTQGKTVDSDATGQWVYQVFLIEAL